MSMIFTVIILIILTALSAFFSASETAFLSISKITLRHMLETNQPGAGLISKLKSNANRLLTTILVGNNLVNNFASSLAAALAISLYGEAGVGIATAFMTVIIIVFGETTPKTLASCIPVQLAQKTALPLRILQIVLHPVVIVFSGISAGIGKAVQLVWSNRAPAVTEEELKTLIELGSQEGTLETGEKEMLHKIFEFTDLKVRDIMKNRSYIQSIPDTVTYAEAAAAFSSSGFSRLPVYSGTLDNIRGILHYKDLLFEYESAKTQDFSLKTLLRSALFIPDSKTAVSLLQTFRAEKQNIAVVIDEHGSTCGLVSMDDLLKAVFGRIDDEYDAEEIPPEDRVEIISQNEYRIPASILLKDLNAMFNTHLVSSFYRTLGGWLLEQFDALPAAGERLRRHNMLFTVEEVGRRKIRSVKMKV